MTTVVAYNFVTRLPTTGISVGAATAVLLSSDVFAFAESVNSGGTVSAIGSSTGVGGASAGGDSVIESVGAADGLGGADGIAEVPFAADGAANGVGEAFGAGDASGPVSADGLAQSAGDAPGVGQGLFFADGQSSGAGSASAEGAQVYSGQGLSDGLGTAAGDGAAVGAGAGVGAAQGVGAAPGVGQQVGSFAAVGSAQGSGAALAVGGSGSYSLAIGFAGGYGLASAETAVVRGAIGSTVGVGDANAITQGGREWPSDILGVPTIDANSFSYQRDNASVKTDMESGFSRHRLINKNATRSVSAAIWLNDSQMQYFNAWTAYGARGGETWFYIDLPIDGPARTVLAKLQREPKIGWVGKDQWKVTLDLTCNDANALSASALDAIAPDDGNFPAALEINPLIDGYSNTRDVSVIVSSAEGLARARDNTRPFRRISLTWWFTNDQLQIFHAWHEYRAKYEAAFFNIGLPIDGPARVVRARFASQPSIKYIGYNLWSCDVELLVRDIPITRSEFVVLEQISLEDLQEIVGDISTLSLNPFFVEWNKISGSAGASVGTGQAYAVAA